MSLERRRYYRLRYPEPLRPIARPTPDADPGDRKAAEHPLDEQLEIVVTEISEGGMRVTTANDQRLPEVGRELSLVISFSDGAEVDIVGATVLRHSANEAALRFDELVPFSLVLAEQRRAIRFERLAQPPAPL